MVAIPKGCSGTHIEELASVRELVLETEDLDLISETYSSQIRWIPVSRISVPGGGYGTPQEAKENAKGFDPSPQVLAESLLEGKMLKPVKVKQQAGETGYVLLEGKIRFWAWVLAYTTQSSIPVFVEKEFCSREDQQSALDLPSELAPTIHSGQPRTRMVCA